METESVFNNLDYIVLTVILLSALLALLRGFVRELFSLVAWVGAYFASLKLYTLAIPLSKHYIKNTQVAEWGAMAIVFVISLIILSVIGYFVCRLIKGKTLTAIDRVLGFFYGLARGVLVVSLVYLGAVMILWPDIDASSVEKAMDTDRNEPPEFLLKAKTRPLLAWGGKALMTFVPQEMLDEGIKSVESQKDELKRVIREETDNARESLDLSTDDDDVKGPIDIDKIFNEESNP